MSDKYKYFEFLLFQILSHIFCIFPIKKNKCVFMSHRDASQYSDSPMYISEGLQRRQKKDYKIVWLVNDTHKFGFLTTNHVKIVKYKSIRGFFELNTARVCVTNAGFAPILARRRNQLRINTLHGGGAYKSNSTTIIGVEEDVWTRKLQRARFGLYNLVLSGCRLSTELNIRDDFCYEGEILENGMPRNDIFFSDNSEIVLKVKRNFNIINEKILLVAPTWRENNNSQNIQIDYTGFANELSEKYGGRWKILLRLHHLSDINLDNLFDIHKEVLIDATKWPNVQELLLSADMLITDYSSLLWDYALQRRPVILFTPDIEEYTRTHGFNVPVEKWGIPYARTNEELIGIVQNTSLQELSKYAEDHLKIFGSYEKGIATKSVCDRINAFIIEE